MGPPKAKSGNAKCTVVAALWSGWVGLTRISFFFYLFFIFTGLWFYLLDFLPLGAKEELLTCPGCSGCLSLGTARPLATRENVKLHLLPLNNFTVAPVTTATPPEAHRRDLHRRCILNSFLHQPGTIHFRPIQGKIHAFQGKCFFVCALVFAFQ